MKERVAKLVAEVLGVDLTAVNEDSSHESIKGWDSMAMINMMMALEAEFGVKLSVEDATRLISVRAISDVLRERGVE